MPFWTLECHLRFDTDIWRAQAHEDVSRPERPGSDAADNVSRIFALVAVVLTGTSYAETLTGYPRVVDADTLAFGKEKVRIEGIDAPEMRQQCRDATGAMYACGKAAAAALRARIGPDEVTCQGDSRDRYQRLIGFCDFSDGADLNGWVVRQGHALAYRKYSTAYVEAENEAKAEGLGIWVGEFEAPWQWRRNSRLEAAKRSTGNCKIKGNIGRGGERIYHVPIGRSYGRTKINESKGERWFCSEKEAREAGWRRAKN